MEWPVGMSATREDRPCPPSQNHGVSMGLPRGKASGKVGGKGRRPVRGVGGGREDQAVSQWAQLPHSSHALVEIKKQKIFPRWVLCSQKENLPAERVRQISFMVRKHPVVIKQAISARTSEHTRKYNRTSHCKWCPEIGGFKLSSKTFDSILFTHLMGPLGIWGPKEVDGLLSWLQAYTFLLHALFRPPPELTVGLARWHALFNGQQWLCAVRA